MKPVTTPGGLTLLWSWRQMLNPLQPGMLRRVVDLMVAAPRWRGGRAGRGDTGHIWSVAAAFRG